MELARGCVEVDGLGRGEGEGAPAGWRGTGAGARTRGRRSDLDAAKRKERQQVGEAPELAQTAGGGRRFERENARAANTFAALAEEAVEIGAPYGRALCRA